jgi:hypothetical protein
VRLTADVRDDHIDPTQQVKRSLRKAEDAFGGRYVGLNELPGRRGRRFRAGGDDDPRSSSLKAARHSGSDALRTASDERAETGKT